MVKSAAVTTIAVGVLAAALAGCGSHQAPDPRADSASSVVTPSSEPSSAKATRAPGHQSRSRAAHGSTHADPHGGASTSQATAQPTTKPTTGSTGSTTTTGRPPKGGYDDTSGTKHDKPKNQVAVLHHLPGVATSQCVAVGERSDVRSGSLAMGNFNLARRNFRDASSAYDAAASFFYVIPRSPEAKTVSVVATRLGGGAPPVRVNSSQVEQAAQWNYFPVQVQLPMSGTWRFRVSTAGEQGCFDASFTT